MPRITRDSYTGDEYQPDYVSPIKGINAPRTLFKTFRYEYKESVRWEAIRHADTGWDIRRVARKIVGATIEETVVERQFVGSEQAARRWLDYCVRTDRRFIRAWRTFIDTGDVDWLLDWSAAGDREINQVVS